MKIYEFERAHFRIRYPTPERPVFRPREAPGGLLPVVDCCEKGLRYRSRGTVPSAGDPVEGIIRFRTGVDVEVSGEVVRVQGGEVAVHLTGEAIPWRIVLHEQLRLRRRYPLCA